MNQPLSKADVMFDFKIIFEDKDIIVCEKPSGALSEGSSFNAMPRLLSQKLQDGEIFCVHRLDRETSGVMVYAKNKSSAAALSEQIREGKLCKEYLAAVSGRLSQDSGQMEDLLFFDRSKNKSFVVKKERRGVKLARLEYSLASASASLSVYRIKLLTGRTHQIRVQLASRGFPLLGDRRYGSKFDFGNRIALHAEKLTFLHPMTGEPLTFISKPSEWHPLLSLQRK